MILSAAGAVMQNQYPEGPQARRGGKEEPDSSPESAEQPGTIARSVQRLLQMGLGEWVVRAATNVFSLAAIIIVIWLAQAYFRQPAARAQANGAAAPTSVPSALPASGSAPLDPSSVGIPLQADLHTNVPERARQEIITYTVQKGDTVSDIADKYGLQPKTIFAANYDVLQDDPHNLMPGQKLRILPVDGVYWQWLGGIPFGQWASYFGVK